MFGECFSELLCHTVAQRLYELTKRTKACVELRRKMNFTCVRVCGVEGPGKRLSGQFFFVCKKDDREESRTKSHDAT